MESTITSLGVPGNYANRVQVHSVLQPLLNWKHVSDPFAIIKGTEKIKQLWLGRLGLCYKLGWRSKRYLHARNCHPTFVVTRQTAKACRLRDICPFCYARNVEHFYTLLDDRLDWDKHGVLQRGFLITRKYRLFMPFTKDPATQLLGLERLIPKSRAKIFRNFKPIGGFATTTTAPGPDKDWLFQLRQLLWVENEADLKKVYEGDVKIHRSINRKEFCYEFAKFLRYPRSLMLGDVLSTAIMLNNTTVRRTQRTGTCGEFYGAKS